MYADGCHDKQAFLRRAEVACEKYLMSGTDLYDIIN